MRTMIGAALACLLVFAAACSSSDESVEHVEPGDVPVAASTGCQVDLTAPLGEDERVTFTTGGLDRWYFRHVPTAAQPGQPLPVVVDLHGYSEGAEVHTMMSDLGAFGDQLDFITITPHGDAAGGTVPQWDAVAGSTDLDFFGELLDEVEDTLCVDTNSVYVTGLSNGAFMTSVIACEYADRVAAVAPVAGVVDVEGCDRDRTVPMVVFHGTDDTYVAFEGGVGPSVADLPLPDGSGAIGDALEGGEELPEGLGLPIPEIVDAWAARNGCEPGPSEEAETDDVVLVTYDCPRGAAVELYRIEGGGHSWPGSAFSAQVEPVIGPTTMSISANAVMWDFFRAHPLGVR